MKFEGTFSLKLVRLWFASSISTAFFFFLQFKKKFFYQKYKCRRQVSHCAHGSGTITEKYQTCHQLTSGKKKKYASRNVKTDFKPEMYSKGKIHEIRSKYLEFLSLRNSFSISHNTGSWRLLR